MLSVPVKYKTNPSPIIPKIMPIRNVNSDFFLDSP